MSLILAVINQSTMVSGPDLERVVAVCHAQLTTQFLPAWRIAAGVATWPDETCMPDGAIPVRIVDEEHHHVGALGDHDETGAYIGINDADLMGVPWSVVLSHELLEAAANPTLARWFPQASKGVEWAGEICDPVENRRYTIAGVEVSDFVFPAFFDEAASGQKLNWRGTLSAPFTVEPPNGHAVTRAADGSAATIPFAPMLGWKRWPGSRIERLKRVRRKSA